MALMEKSISVSELRERLKSVIDECARKGQRFNIICNSHPEAVLVGLTEWRMLNETLDILNDQHLMTQIRNAGKEIESGETDSASDVFDDIEKELGEE